MNLFRWIGIAVIIYFLLVVLFLSFGFGKLMNLMGGDGAWQFFKDVLEVLSWLATIIGIYVAVETYRSSVADKKLREVWDAFSEFKAYSKAEDFCLNWNTAYVAYSMFLNSKISLSPDTREKFESLCSAYVRDLLKQFTFKSYFGKDLINEDENIIEQLKTELRVPLVDVKLGFYLYRHGLATRFNKGDLWCVKDPYGMPQFFSKLICIGQPILNGTAYKPKQHFWEFDELSSLDILIGEIPAGIIRLIYSPSAYKNSLFDSIERKCIG